MKEYIMSYYLDKEFNPKFVKSFTLLTIGFTLYHLFIKETILKLANTNEDEIHKNSFQSPFGDLVSKKT